MGLTIASYNGLRKRQCPELTYIVTTCTPASPDSARGQEVGTHLHLVMSMGNWEERQCTLLEMRRLPMSQTAIFWRF